MSFKVYFIGIGGIGVSALARYYLTQGWEVSGSDVILSEITKALQKLGIRIYSVKQNIKKMMPDLVIYSPAIKENNSELKQARQLGIKTISYPQALGELTKKYYTIAVAGAHGKSTTTAMIGLMMAQVGLDPTVVVGTKVKEFGNTNFRLGKSEYLVIEACEYDQSFLNYWPQIIVLTNIEMDHVECYGNEAKLIKTFNEFINHLPQNGSLAACVDDKNVAKLIGANKKADFEIKKYSLKMSEAKKLRKIMQIPGEHNINNGLAALTVGRLLKISDNKIFASLAKYKGSWRRFEQEKGSIGGKKNTVISDYGHHPTQIKLTMQACRQKWPNKTIICVFQPHQAWRTYLLFKDFVAVFKNNPLNKIFITDIYQVSGRESGAITKKINSKKLVAAIKNPNVEYIPNAEIYKELAKTIKGGEVILIMGAGDIYNLAKKLVFGFDKAGKKRRNNK